MATLRPGNYEIDLVRGNAVKRTVQVRVDPEDAKAMRLLLLAEMKKWNGDKEWAIQKYELRVRLPRSPHRLMVFTAVK
jgi:hypothetical protein